MPLIVVWYSWLKSERFWHYALYFLFFLGFLGGVYIGALLIVPHAPMQSFQAKAVAARDPSAPNSTKKYAHVASGALSLKERYVSKFSPSLRDQLQFHGVSSRPGQQEKIYLSLKSSEQKLAVDPGESFFVSFQQRENEIPLITGFSKEKTAVKLTISSYDESSLQVDIVSQKGEGDLVDEDEIFIERISAENVFQLPSVQQLQSAKWLGTDLFLLNYGGKEYAEYNDKQMVEFFDGKESTICYLSAKSFIVWKEGRWQEASQDDLQSSLPVAQVVSISLTNMELRFWDESGLVSSLIQLQPDRSERTSVFAELSPHSLHLRNDTQVSCLVNNRHLILKEGDWLLRTSSGWKSLKRANEIDDYVKHQIRGELIVFDRLENEAGRRVMKGRFFDKNRTQMQPFVFSVNSDKTRAQPKKKR